MSDKLCAVCGDRALGHNFGALTCESCRSFFRRNANRAQRIFCYFGNQCVVNQKTRKLCKKCRIDKCFFIGMKKRLIHTYKERELIAKSNDLKQIKYKERSLSQVLTDSSPSDVMSLCRKYGMSDNTTNTAISHISDIIRGVIFSFNDWERHRLKQLFKSTAFMKDPVVKTISEPITTPEIIQIIHMRSEIHCMRIIKMCKTMTEFRDLCETDQIILLKACCPELICLLSILTFDFVGEFWTVYISTEDAAILRFDVLRMGVHNIYDFQKTFMNKLNEECSNDMNLIDLLTAIVLFNPNRPNLIQKDQINLQRETYIYLLQRYLELKHNSKTEAEIRFTRLMNCLQDLYSVDSLFASNYFEYSGAKRNQLIAEILS